MLHWWLFKSMFSYWWGSVFTMGMITGLWISISSSSWMGVWMGLELNLLCFIPVMAGRRYMISESVVIYFMVQACGSLMLFMADLNLMSYESMFDVIISVALLLKMGAAPFHFWFIEVANKLKWVQFLVLSTIQKIAPLALLSLTHSGSSSWVFYFSIMMCGSVGAVGGVSSLSLRKLLIYSSINHLGWVLLLITNKNSLWVIYFMIYCLMLLLVIMILMKYSIFHIGQLKGAQIFWGGGASLLIGLLSLGGLPPFLGFAAKWLVISACVNFADLICLVVLILSSIVSVYFYIRVNFMVLTINSAGKFKSPFKNQVETCLIIVSVSMIGLWVSTLMWS